MSDTGFDLEQMPFISSTFAENPEPRCPCILLLDTSGSMSGQPIAELNGGYARFISELREDALASKRVELCVITFGPVELRQDFATPDQIYPEAFQVSGDTPMGAAIKRAIKELKLRKEAYQQNGVPYYRPWIFMITDGAPTDAWAGAAKAIRKGEASNSFAFFAVGVRDADLATLAEISDRDPLKLKGLQFAELFRWLSNSLKSVSHSAPGDKIALPAPSGWGEV